MFTDSNGERSFLQHGQNYKSAKIEAYHELHLKKIKKSWFMDKDLLIIQYFF